MKKKDKHKRKKKQYCPHYGEELGEEYDGYRKCKKCSLRKKCKAAYHKSLEGATWDDEDEQPKKGKPKKPKAKREPDGRGSYIPFPALNKLLKLTNHFCVKQYLFYMKVGIIQKTNQIWSNNNHVAKSLKCDKDRVRISKNQLIKAGYITIIYKRGKRGRFGQSYIKLKHFPSKFVIEKQEYLRQLDEYERQLDQDVEDFAEWCDAFTSQIMKLKIKLMEQKKRSEKWKRKFKKLKQG